VDLLSPSRLAARREAPLQHGGDPGVIVTDYALPNGNAHYLLWRLRNTLETGRIPVPVMTANPLDQASLRREVSGRPGKLARGAQDKDSDLMETDEAHVLVDVVFRWVPVEMPKAGRVRKQAH
jgi:CheY-like chemotaxis protein